VAQGLDQTLSDLITLDLTVRQARQNLAGRPSRSVQRLLDGLVDAAREAGNRIAARSTQLGHNPNLWSETAARRKALRLVDADALSDADTYSAFEQILDTITARLSANIRATDCDLVTQGLLIDFADRLDNLAWTIRPRSAA
jgi:starvation-inducible DNA-binding protein